MTENLLENDETISDDKAIDIWNNVLTAALKLPGARVNREDFLRKEFSKYYNEEEINKTIENGYKNSNIEKKIVDGIADSVINYHTGLATTTSFVAGLPGGWWLAAAVPADLAQFYYHVIVVAQKLAYLYGWPSFDAEEPTDEFLGLLTLFIGIMSGAQIANSAIGKLANKLAIQVAKQLPKVALTKYGLYNVVKQLAKWFGISLTKQTFAKGVAKAIPIIGGLISGGVTLVTFLPMANKLQKYLSELPLAKDGKEYQESEDNKEKSEA